MLPKFEHSIQLVIALGIVGATGCISRAPKTAEVTDPFLPSNTATIVAAVEEPLTQSTIELASFTNVSTEPSVENLQTPTKLPSAPIHETEGVLRSGVYPIDLANALGLGGADNLQIRLARTRLFQAQARHFEAKTLWLPSIRYGVGYNKHDGPLQETEGRVLEINRNSLFYGGGLGLGAAPLTAGASGPPRLFVNLSLADAYFKPLSASQEVAAHGAAERVASNDSLAEIAVGYHTLLEAHGLLANANAARDMTQEMVGLVENFEREGFSSKTEVHRARTELGQWQREAADAQRSTMVRSSELARVLRLPAQVQLVPVEEFVLPIEVVDSEMDIDAMIAVAWGSRPEIFQYSALREAACFRVKEEQWRPWIPSVQVAASAGGFGGGPSTEFSSTAGRSDVDLLAVWEWKNLGLGNVATQRLRRGELHERVLELEAVRDLIASEVVSAAADVASYQQQMEITQEAINAAKESYQLNKQRIRANEGLPIELLQSISALAEVRTTYTKVVANYNRAQYRLMRAMGNPPGISAEAIASANEPMPVEGE